MRTPLPPLRALLALEAIVETGGVTRAAEELGTSQSAVSRSIRRLEEELAIPLLAKSGRGIVLTPEGLAYWTEVRPALEVLRQAGRSARAGADEINIACTHEVSHLLIMPVYSELRKALKKETRLRILTCEYQAVPAMVDSGADIIFEYRSSPPKGRGTALLREAIRPAASPDFLKRHEVRLREPPVGWSGVPTLALTKENSGWAQWEDWFDAQSTTRPDVPVETFDNYVYALEAATRGEGMVLAWQGFADRYLASGALVPVTREWLVRRQRLYACLTHNGAKKPAAEKCVRFLASAIRGRKIAALQ